MKSLFGNHSEPFVRYHKHRTLLYSNGCGMVSFGWHETNLDYYLKESFEYEFPLFWETLSIIGIMPEAFERKLRSKRAESGDVIVLAWSGEARAFCLASGLRSCDDILEVSLFTSELTHYIEQTLTSASA